MCIRDSLSHHPDDIRVLTFLIKTADAISLHQITTASFFVELVEAIYSEMAEFGFLTRYIYGDGIEEININSWRDIEVQYSDCLLYTSTM